MFSDHRLQGLWRLLLSLEMMAWVTGIWVVVGCTDWLWELNLWTNHPPPQNKLSFGVCLAAAASNHGGEKGLSWCQAGSPASARLSFCEKLAQGTGP